CTIWSPISKHFLHSGRDPSGPPKLENCQQRSSTMQVLLSTQQLPQHPHLSCFFVCTGVYSVSQNHGVKVLFVPSSSLQLVNVAKVLSICTHIKEGSEEEKTKKRLSSIFKTERKK